jgi:hypothetical protein
LYPRTWILSIACDGEQRAKDISAGEIIPVCFVTFFLPQHSYGNGSYDRSFARCSPAREARLRIPGSGFTLTLTLSVAISMFVVLNSKFKHFSILSSQGLFLHPKSTSHHSLLLCKIQKILSFKSCFDGEAMVRVMTGDFKRP